MMIRLTLDNGASAVNLFREHEANHLVREGHL